MKNTITKVRNYILLFLVFMCQIKGFAQCPASITTVGGVTTVTFTSGSCNWNVPAGVTEVTVEAWGGGGGSGGVRVTHTATIPSYAVTGGGKGGMYARTENVSVAEGDVLGVVVGGAGAAGTGSSTVNATSGGAGGNSSVTANATSTVLVSALGGNGSGGANSLSGSGGSYNAGSTGASTYAAGTAVGTVTRNGGNGGGACRTASRATSGGGGGGAGTNNVGVGGLSGEGVVSTGLVGSGTCTPSPTNGGGAGGTDGGGAGGNRVGLNSNAATAGTNANTIGGGAGGAVAWKTSTSTSTDRGANGGTGARGEVRISYTIPCTNPSAGAVSGAESSCDPFNPSNITSLTAASGESGGTLQYQWQISTTSASTGFTDISGATGADYDPPSNITQTTWYRRLARVSCKPDWSDALATAAIAKTVNVPSATGLSSGDWLWTGAVSTTYEDAANWKVWDGTSFTTPSGVPQTTNNVRIKQNGTCIVRQPTVTNAANAGWGPPSSVGANCQNMVIENGAILTMGNTNPHFHVGSSLTNNGTIVTGTGRLKFVGTGSATLNSVNATETFYELNIGLSAITTINTNVTVTNILNLRGVLITGSYILHLTNTATLAAMPDYDGHIYGNFRRSIASNTGVYPFPVGVGSTHTSNRRLLEFVNNNITGVTYLTCSASNTFKGSGSNVDASLDPLKAKHFGEIFTTVRPEAEWTLTPNASPSGGSYGVALYLQNFAALTDNNFSVLKRPDASASFFDFDSYYLSTAIPGVNLPGRVYAGGSGFALKSGLSSFSKFVVASSPTPLPVTLTAFSAQCKDLQTNLKWTTVSESNSQKFIVQKSRDIQHWIDVDEVSAAGNSNKKISYTMTDENPFSAISYYRLVQRDMNGSEKIYGPISVSCENIENGMTVFPSPSQGDFTVEILSNENINETELQIIDVRGKIISVRKINVMEGKTLVMFEKTGLERGTYIVRLVSENHAVPFKMIIE